MIPLRDANPRGGVPIVALALIALNCLVFFYELTLPPAGLEQLVFTFGMVPAKLTAFPTDPGVSFGDATVPFLTSMFLHGGWLHLIGNMWFLWIFGDNVEDYLGHVRFLLFYLLCGLAASVAHLAFNLNSIIPTLGASGAIAGVLGAYLLLFPGARILTLVPVFFVWLMELPAYVILIYWFVLQLLQGTATLAESAPGGGVAWWAHVGGFVAGLALVKIVASRRRRSYVIRQ
ncbi:MAG: rhomboid family intramembrane serine protease [Candidatus Acidiferrales bacterium]